MKVTFRSIFPAITAFISFILTLLCLFAGSQKNLLNNADLLTVGGESEITQAHADSCQLYTPEGDSGTGHNFYSVHVMSYCQGVLETVEAGETSVARNVTECSSRTLLFAFNPTDAWPEEITHGPTLEWPRVISDDFHAFSFTSRSMAVFYIIGVGAIGFALVSRLSSAITRKAKTGLFEFGFMLVGHSVSWQGVLLVLSFYIH